MTPAAPALELDRVAVAFDGRRVVEDVSLALAPGQVLAVLGPSGSGKSTLLRAVAGLEPLAAGRVLADGADLAGVPTHRRGFALMFQDGQLFGHQSVAANVGYPLRLRRAPRREREARVAELLDLVGLPSYGERSPATLSGGERQRVALARALAVRPRLLLLDEPLSALDRSLRERLATDLRAILRAEGTTALLVTHDHEEAFTVADRMAVLRDGGLVQEGTLEEVWRGPADAATARFLGYARVVDAATAVRLGAPGGPLALRRSALVVDPAGALAATVSEARLTPELARLVVEVEGIGTLDAVAGREAVVRPGDRVRLRLDPGRTAVVPEGSGSAGDDLHTGGRPSGRKSLDAGL